MMFAFQDSNYTRVYSPGLFIVCLCVNCYWYDERFLDKCELNINEVIKKEGLTFTICDDGTAKMVCSKFKKREGSK